MPRCTWPAGYDPVVGLTAGEQFAGFRIIRPLGAGGMGEVYLVEHPRLPRQEALKVLSPELSADPDYRQRFASEADLAAKLWHPHIVEVRDRGEADGQLWISMAYVDGQDAARLLAQKYPAGMPAEQVIPIVAAVASALDYAHGQGTLHRDVKPANIFVSSPDASGESRVLLGDFGIARDLAARPPSADEMARVLGPLNEQVARAASSSAFFMWQIEGGTQDPARIAAVPSIFKDYAQVTPEVIQQLAARYLVAGRAWRLAVLPQSRSASAGGAAGVGTAGVAAGAAAGGTRATAAPVAGR